MKGQCPDFHPITISADQAFSGPQPLGNRSSGSSKNEAPIEDGEQGCDPQNDSLDLLSLICAPPAPHISSNSRGKKANVKMTTSELRNSLINTVEKESEFDQTLSLESEDCISQELLEAVGDASVANNLDEETAASIIAAFRFCKQHHHSAAAASCVFEDTAPHVSDATENDLVEPELFCDGDKRETLHNPSSSAQPSKKRSSRKHQDAERAVGSSSTSSSAALDVCETDLGIRGDKTVKLWHYRHLQFGNVPYMVRSVGKSGVSTAVGQIAVMSSKRSTSYKATCSMHRNCQCWVYSLEGGNLDKVLQWIVAGLEASAEDHLRLSNELRESLGIKVRK